MAKEYDEEISLLDILLDQDNREPIVLADCDGNEIAFEQVAIVPLETNGDNKLYCVLKPIDKMEGVGEDEAIVFVVDTDDNGEQFARIEGDEDISDAVFDKYYEMLENAISEQTAASTDENDEE